MDHPENVKVGDEVVGEQSASDSNGAFAVVVLGSLKDLARPFLVVLVFVL